MVWRLRSNGNPDTSFNETGARAIDSGGFEHLRALLVQPDGKLVAVGDTSVNKDGAFYRLTTDGQFDKSFDGDGAIGVDAGGTEILTGAVLQPDGNLVAVGTRRDRRGRGGVPPARRPAHADGHDTTGAGTVTCGGPCAPAYDVGTVGRADRDARGRLDLHELDRLRRGAGQRVPRDDERPARR